MLAHAFPLLIPKRCKKLGNGKIYTSCSLQRTSFVHVSGLPWWLQHGSVQKTLYLFTVIKYCHTPYRYLCSRSPIASHSPGTLFLNASIRLPFPTTSGFGFSHQAVCCFPVTFDSTVGRFRLYSRAGSDFTVWTVRTLQSGRFAF